MTTRGRYPRSRQGLGCLRPSTAHPA
jgi:hypothetical protein